MTRPEYICEQSTVDAYRASWGMCDPLEENVRARRRDRFHGTGATVLACGVIVAGVFAVAWLVALIGGGV